MAIPVRSTNRNPCKENKAKSGYITVKWSPFVVLCNMNPKEVMAYKSISLVDSSPQAASMSWPREARMVAMMPFSFKASRNQVIVAASGLFSGMFGTA